MRKKRSNRVKNCQIRPYWRVKHALVTQNCQFWHDWRRTEPKTSQLRCGKPNYVRIRGIAISRSTELLFILFFAQDLGSRGHLVLEAAVRLRRASLAQRL